MTKARLPSGEEVMTSADASDVEFVQHLVALNDKITHEINLQAKGLFLEEGWRGDAGSFNQLKELVNEMHALLSDATLADAT
jgi:hypothetical protein